MKHHIIKFADDSVIAALLADDDVPEHSPIVKEFTDSLHDNNVTKTKEISVSFQEDTPPPLS